MKNFIRKYGLTVLGLLFAGGSYIVESKKAKIDNETMKEDIKNEILKELAKDLSEGE